MPGKGTENAWRYVTPPTLLRSAAASDAAGSAGVDAIVEKLTDNFGSINTAYDNCLYVYAVAPAAVTAYVLEVWVNPLAVDGAGAPITGAEKWCLVAQSGTNTTSAVLKVRDLPPGEVKVAVKSYAGSGTIKVCTAKSA